MKIAISATGKEMDSILDRRFGRCAYFLIYDTETKEVEAIRNNGATASGGAGIAAASQVMEKNVEVVLTGNLGPNAFELLEKGEVKAYSCEAVLVSQAIEMFNQNELTLIAAAGSAHHGM